MLNQEMEYLPFDAITVPLEGSNLIEASAGTGKTYSIAILCLRLILEQNIALEKILMVTFTKAAVAELQERVRLFIKLAEQSAMGQDIEDHTITALVAQSILTTGSDEIQQRLKDAVLLMDELSILTIHGFCQQTLTEFAFETGQLFGAEMFTELDDVVTESVNEFWRKHITTMDPEVLSLLQYQTLRNDLKTIIHEQLQGKKYASFDPARDYAVTDLTLEKFEALQTQVRQRCLEQEQHVWQSFEQYKGEITAICNKSKARNKAEFIALLDDAKAFIALVNAKENVLTKALPEAFLQVNKEANTFISKADEIIQLEFKSTLYGFAIKELVKTVQHFLLKNNLLGYNDLIRNLYLALTEKSNPALVKALQDKYKAVFVDEFQDTDKEQYEIFNSAFKDNSIIFLIGDPKQSIYAWRKADIFTYFQAKRAVDRCYSMNVNFRSSAPMIDAMNHFFRPQPNFDTFCFQDKEDKISYVPVESPGNNSKGLMLYYGKMETPLSIYQASKKEDIQISVADQIQTLLTDSAYTIEKNGKERHVKPSDIGILVRTNSEGLGIKNMLAQRGIAAIMLHDARVLGTVEASEMFYILDAIFEPTISTINRALLTSFTGFNIAEIQKINEEQVLAFFQEYKDIWQNEGVYSALMRFLRDFNVIKVLLADTRNQGELKLSIFYQLAELLHQSQYYKTLNQEELLSWFKRGINGLETQGDEYLLRMESDDDSVKIVTIHKSKGLEYNIVFAPFLDMMAQNSRSWQTFREPASGDYYAKESLLLTEEEKQWNEEQLEQENRRLVYVAITRAVYKCYVYKNGYYKFNQSSLAAFYQALMALPVLPPTLEIGILPQLDPKSYYAALNKKDQKPLIAKHFILEQDNWYKLSYTGISIHPEQIPKERPTELDTEYDRFVFSGLRLGAGSGNLLHDIFEKVDFRNEEFWIGRITEIVKGYLPQYDEALVMNLNLLLKHVLQAQISIDDQHFSLSEVAMSRRISELEFDFPLQDLKTLALNTMSTPTRSVQVKGYDGLALSGIMNGKIDLFFEHNQRFYVLDWKSNYLGFKAEDYDSEGVLRAMNDNNYHLQYLIYTVAVKKYLERRMPSFDYDTHFGGVVYMFLRGIRKDGQTGIFTARPTLAEVERMEEILQGV